MSALLAEAERESQEAEADHEFEQLVLDREIDWKEYESSGMNYINKKELGMILDYDKQTNDQPDLLADVSTHTYIHTHTHRQSVK